MIKRFRCLTATLAAALACSAPLFAIDNDDILKMYEAGLSESTILLAIEREKADFDTSADALVELKEAGVSEAVIQKILAPGSKPKAGAASTPANRPTTSTAGNGSATDEFWQDHPSIAPPMVDPVEGQDYFLRFTLYQERDRYRVANYGRGILVPINTPVKLLSIGDESLLLQRLDNGAELRVDNEEKYSQTNPAGVARLMLSEEKTPLDRLPQKVASAIRLGELRRGMTKEQVLMARGYPPVHETPSTESDRWVYWSSRFVKHTIVFNNDRLIDGRGIY